jgi:tartrate dehydratase alpha subunit/fumarate hydratase class I-like protein
MAKKYQAPLVVRVSNVLTLTLLRAGVGVCPPLEQKVGIGI